MSNFIQLNWRWTCNNLTSNFTLSVASGELISFVRIKISKKRYTVSVVFPIHSGAQERIQCRWKDSKTHLNVNIDLIYSQGSLLYSVQKKSNIRLNKRRYFNYFICSQTRHWLTDQHGKLCYSRIIVQRICLQYFFSIVSN